jgi:hypothetical protein
MAAHKHTPGRRLSKDKTCHTRTLKVRKGIYSHIIKDKDHSSFDCTVYATVPWINLQGQWLDQAGFSIHTPIKIRVMKGCLVVTAIDRQAEL